MENALIDHVTFDFSTPKRYDFQDIPRSFPIHCLNTLGSFVFELCCTQTDRQTGNRRRPGAHPMVTKQLAAK